jgi:hypothetical protein
MPYNYFGATYEDCVRRFPGAILEDFSSSTTGTSGEAILYIQAEMGYIEEEIINNLHSQVLNFLNEPTLVLVDNNGDDTYTLPFPGDGQEVTIYEYNPVSTSNSNYSLCGVGNNCVNLAPLEATSYNPSISGSVMTVSGGPEQLWVTYTAETSGLELPSLKKILLDGTCCVIGSALYSTNQDGRDWNLVEKFCESYKMMLEEIKNGWIPPELKRLKTKKGFSTYKNSLTSIKIGRA